MDNTKTISRKAKGGIVASVLVLLFTLLTLGSGIAHANELMIFFSFSVTKGFTAGSAAYTGDEDFVFDLAKVSSGELAGYTEPQDEYTYAPGSMLPSENRRTVTVKANGGAASFGQIIFTLDGDYYFKVTEREPATKTPGMTYNTNPTYVRVNVSDGGDVLYACGTDLEALSRVDTSAMSEHSGMGNIPLEIDNTYSTPALITPNTVNVSLARNDGQGGGNPTPMTLVETLPQGMSPETVDSTSLVMTVGSPGQASPAQYNPTPDAGTNSFVYNFQIENGQTMSVPIVEGSEVVITNRSTTDDITQNNGSPSTQSGQTLRLSVAPNMQPQLITFGASPKAAPAHPQRAQGWIRVNRNSSVNNAVTYEAFKVFDAAVSYDGTDYKGTHLEWESDAVKNAVMGFLRNAENSGEYTAWLASKYGKDANSVTAGDQELAQNAAEWIAKKIGESDEDTTANTTPKTTKGDTFASKLATVLRNYSLVPIPVPANTVTPVEQGYYVVATATSTIDDGEAGTAPIWAPVPQTGYTVDEKVSIPRFNKQVKDNTDDTENYNKVADASTNQPLDFRLTTTLPANVKAFPTYPLTIVDDLPDGMDPLELNQANGYSVYLGEADITSQVVATSTQGGVLTFSIANALALDGIDGNGVITVNYRAKLNENAVKGSEGNENTATLTYPADPMTSETGELTSSAKVLTYQLRVDKVDAANRLNVDGAQFNAKTTVGSTEYWVAQNGSLTTDASQKGTWTTTNGTFTISGVDEGTYSIIEAQAPERYEVIASPLSITIDAQKDYAVGALTALGVSALSGANGNLVSQVTSAADDGYVGSDLGTGIVRVRISDIKQIVLPLTGMPVKTLGIIVGVGIAIASVVAFIVKRHKERNEEEVEEEGE